VLTVTRYCDSCQWLNLLDFPSIFSSIFSCLECILQLFVSSEDGKVTCIDVRESTRSLFTLQAHDKTCNTISFSQFAPNLLATGSIDKSVKLWDVSNNKPVLIDTITSDLGTVFTSGFCVDSPFLLAAAGGKGKLNVLDLMKQPKVAKHFSAWMSSQTQTQTQQ
jgi:periodic tryptophan protein 1